MVLTHVHQVVEEQLYCVRFLQPFEEAGLYSIHNLEFMKERCTAFKGLCVGKEAMSFRAGSYANYNEYRQSLAGLIGATAEEVWDDPENFKDEDFFEQIEFPDNEGTFDYIVAMRLYSAYERNELQALELFDPWDYGLYCKFKEAFKLAAEGKGIVIYH